MFDNLDGYGFGAQIFRDEEDYMGHFPRPALSDEHIERVLGPELAKDEVMVSFLIDAVEATKRAI